MEKKGKGYVGRRIGSRKKKDGFNARRK